mgnify:CR=1 FL=1
MEKGGWEGGGGEADLVETGGTDGLLAGTYTAELTSGRLSPALLQKSRRGPALNVG